MATEAMLNRALVGEQITLTAARIEDLEQLLVGALDAFVAAAGGRLRDRAEAERRLRDRMRGMHGLEGPFEAALAFEPDGVRVRLRPAEGDDAEGTFVRAV